VNTATRFYPNRAATILYSIKPNHMNATQTCVCLDAADCRYLQNQNLSCVQLSQFYEYWGCDCCTVDVACNKTNETNDYLYVGLSTAFGVGIIACYFVAAWYGDHFNSDNVD
jgi:hypothetical protein